MCINHFSFHYRYQDNKFIKKMFLFYSPILSLLLLVCLTSSHYHLAVDQVILSILASTTGTTGGYSYPTYSKTNFTQMWRNDRCLKCYYVGLTWQVYFLYACMEIPHCSPFIHIIIMYQLLSLYLSFCPSDYLSVSPSTYLPTYLPR